MENREPRTGNEKPAISKDSRDLPVLRSRFPVLHFPFSVHLPFQYRHQHRRGVIPLLAAAVLRQRQLGAVDLALAGTALQLLGQLDDLCQAGRADRVPLAQQAARGVYRQAAAELGGS